MKIAIAASLQGWPEESSPETPTDSTRIARYIAGRLASLLPDHEVAVFDRERYPGMGDCYLKLRNDITNWGANIAVHIHQDALKPGMRGWCVLYRNASALSLANYIVSSMRSIPSPFRGIFYRQDVAVLKSPPITVLVECGFYTSPEDEAIGTEGWGGPIVNGILQYLLDKHGIKPREEVVLVPKIIIDRENGMMDGRLVYHLPAFRKDWWLDLGYEGPGEEEVIVWVNQQSNVGGKKPAARRIVYSVPGTLNPDKAPGLHTKPCVMADPDWVVLSIHSRVPLVIFAGP